MASQSINLLCSSSAVIAKRHEAHCVNLKDNSSRNPARVHCSSCFIPAKHELISGNMHALRQRCSHATRSSRNVIFMAATADTPHLQLATAKLPGDVDVGTFVEKLYQWAATATSSGMNLPLALPLRVTRQKEGFEMSMLRMRDTTPVSVADITVTVEPVNGQGMVMFVRFFEAEGSDLAVSRRQGDDMAYLRTLSQALVDVPTIMGSMPPAIKLAVVQSRN